MDNLLLNNNQMERAIYNVTSMEEYDFLRSIEKNFYENKALCKAQLAHCEPLIRADERAKVAQEIFGKLVDSFTHADASVVCRGCVYLPCFNREGKCFSEKCLWWQDFKKQYKEDNNG